MKPKRVSSLAIEDVNDLLDRDAESGAQPDKVRQKIATMLQKADEEARTLLFRIEYALTIVP